MVKVDIDVTLTPEKLAEEFCNLESDEQARFYNTIAKIATPYNGRSWLYMQLQYITEENGLSLEGRRVMQTIGEYSHWGLVCNLMNKSK